MPTLEINLILFALYTALIFGGGFEVESWRLQAKHAKELQTQITATNTAEKKADDVAKRFEVATQSSRDTQAQLLEKWRIADETPHTVCMLPDSSLRLLHAATAPAISSR